MAIKPCNECNAEVSTKAFRCPACGTSNPTLDKEKIRKNLFATLIGLVALIGIPFLMSYEGPSNQQVAQSQPPSSAEIQETLNYMKELDWIKDATYQDYSTIQWHIGILDDGRHPYGTAQAICEMLSLRDLVNDTTRVRVVDIKKVSRGETFRKASLGRLHCASGETSHP